MVSKKCLHCGKTKTVDKYAKCEFNNDNLEVYCRDCKKKLINSLDKLKDYLKLNNTKFNQNCWDHVIEKVREIELKKYNPDNLPENITEIIESKSIGRYYAQSNLSGDFKASKSVQEVKNKNKQKKNSKKIDKNDLEELEEKWGYGYSEEEYYLFEKKWKKLIDNYGEKTSLHTEGLLTYIRFRVKEELATAQGLIKDAKEWGSLASQAAKDAKLNVAQLSKSDLSGGVDLVTQLFEAVESEVGIIPLLPKVIEQPYDDADIIIWVNINYYRRLDGKQRIEYRDIWNFYDEMLEEICKQQGYNDEQINEFKNKRNNVFRDLGQIYKEPLYEEGDS